MSHSDIFGISTGDNDNNTHVSKLDKLKKRLQSSPELQNKHDDIVTSGTSKSHDHDQTIKYSDNNDKLTMDIDANDFVPEIQYQSDIEQDDQENQSAHDEI